MVVRLNLITSTTVVISAPLFRHWSLKTHIVDTRPHSGAIDNLLLSSQLQTFHEKVPQ